MAETEKLAAILVRGEVGLRHDVKKTLQLLNMGRKHICVVIENNPVNRGLLQKVKDFVTFGPVSEETVKELRDKRSTLKDKEGKHKDVFRLHPPIGGFERKGIKVSFNQGGALGLRKEGMDALIKRMI
jgi:large subunit ribosomal protein L30